MRLLTVLMLLTLAGCHSDPAKKQSSNTDNVASEFPHLQDTTVISGSCILFLRPDEQRFNHYSSEPGIYDVDSDFGFAISNTLNSLTANKRFRGISGSVSTKRYILIRDCASGPKIIDRDTIDYGVILSAKGRKIETLFGSVHGVHYLQEAGDYFGISF